MWYPRNSLFSTENFSSLKTGEITYSNFNQLNNLGGYLSLRNVSTTTGVIIPQGQPWPAIDWLVAKDLSIPWSLNSGSIKASGGIPVWNPAYQTTSLTGTTSIFFSGLPITFAEGYVVECGLFVSSQTGNLTGDSNKYGLVIQDSTGASARSDSVLLTTYPTPGLWINTGHTTEAFIPASGIDEGIFNFRIGRRGSLLQVVGQNGYTAITTGFAPATGILPFSGLAVGNISQYVGGQSTDPASRTELNHLYLNYPIDDVAGDFIADTEYVTGDVLGFIGNFGAGNLVPALLELQSWPYVELSSFTPEKPIRGYSSVTYKLDGDSVDGIIVIGALLDDGSAVIMDAHVPSISYKGTPGIYSILAENTLPPINSYKGSLRFRVYSVAKYGTYKPPLSLDYITVAVNSDDHDGLIYVYPEFGSSDGNYPVVIGIDPLARSHVGPPSTNDSSLISLVNMQGNTVSDVAPVAAGSTFINYNGSTGNLLIDGYLGRTPRSFDNTQIQSSTVTEEIFRTISEPIEGVNYKTISVGNRGKLLASTGYAFLWPSGGLTGGNFTGRATGTGGYWLTPYYASGLTQNLNDPVFYEPVKMLAPGSDGSVFNIGQRVRAREGYGFQAKYLDGSSFITGDLVIESTLSCTEGAVGISVVGYDSNNVYSLDGTNKYYVVYPSQRFSNTQKVKSIFPRPTGKFNINVVGLLPSTTGSITGTTVCDFSISDINIGIQSGMGFDITSTNVDKFCKLHSTSDLYSSGCTMDLWVKPNGFTMITDNYTGNGAGLLTSGNDSIISSIYGTIDHCSLLKTWAASNVFNNETQRSIVLDRAGFPVFVTTSTNGYKNLQLKSKIGLEVNKWNHVAAVVSPGSDIELYVNGELAAYHTGSEAITFGNFAPLGTFLNVGQHFCGHLEYARVRIGTRSAAQIRALDSFIAPPRFTTSHEIGDGGSFAYYRFGKGTLIDYASGKNHCIIPEADNARLYTERNVEGVVGDAVAFNNNYGYAHSKTAVKYTGSGYSVGGYIGCLSDYSLEPRIFKFGNSSLDIKNGKLRYSYSGSTFTGITDVINPFAYRPFMVAHQYVSGTLLTGTHIWAYVGTGQGTGDIGAVMQFSGFSTGGTIPKFNDTLYLGHNSSNPSDVGDVFIDQLFFHTGTLRNLDHIDYRRDLRDPDEYVYFNNVRLTGTRVSHPGVYEKEVYMPARTEFSYTGATINISVDTDAGYIDVAPAFTYIGTRYLVADPVTREKIGDISEKICKTKSPFRIGNRVPKDAVNLAYLTTTTLSPESSMSFIDGSASIEQNLVNAVRTYEVLPPVTGVFDSYANTSITITGQVNTDDFVLTTYTMSRPEVDFPAPLFYAHRLGNEELYPTIIGGQDAVSGDFVELRRSIRLTDEDGLDVPIENFPWDIRVSKYREDGIILPENVYSVDVLSRDKFINGKTIFANYNAVNPVNNYKVIRNHSEVINPKPIYRRITSTTRVTGETYSASYLPEMPDLSRSIPTNPIKFTVNLRTGEWTPYMQDFYIAREEMPEI